MASFDNMSPAAMAAWQRLVQTRPDLVQYLTSTYRDPATNKRVGGANKSQHVHGNAFDMKIPGLSEAETLALVRDAWGAGFRGVGVYGPGVLHFDVGPARHWGPDYSGKSTPKFARGLLSDLMNGGAPPSRDVAGYKTQGGGMDYHALAREAARREGIPEDLFFRLIKQESGFRPDVTSPKGAHGLAQLMPGTAEELGVDPRDPAQNLAGGARYLRQMYDEFGDWRLAAAAYNAGPGRVREYGGPPPFKETKHYVDAVVPAGWAPAQPHTTRSSPRPDIPGTGVVPMGQPSPVTPPSTDTGMGGIRGLISALTGPSESLSQGDDPLSKLGLLKMLGEFGQPQQQQAPPAIAPRPQNQTVPYKRPENEYAKSLIAMLMQ